jgi:hypothetical protein
MSRAPANTLSVYKNKPFARFAKKAHITDADLWKAAVQANDGMIDANLGGGVIKQRIARPRQGKSGGSRTIILFRKSDRAVYVFGFEKKDVANISASDLVAFREFAATYLGFTAAEMEQLVGNGTLYQIERPKERPDE